MATGQSNQLQLSKERSKRSLLNEVKGNLFEYLVAQKVASIIGYEDFIFNLSDEFRSVLSQQTRFVREYATDLTAKLDQWSFVTAQELIQKYPETSYVYLVGKMSQSSSDGFIHESDLILENNKQELTYISLKLFRYETMINVKSAGIKSIFSEYFGDPGRNIQQEFSTMFDQEFKNFCYELHQINEVEFLGDFSNWVQKSLPLLPGQLEGENRNLLKSFYAKISRHIQSRLEMIKSINEKIYRDGILKLCGFTNSLVQQLHCGYEENNLNLSWLSRHDLEPEDFTVKNQSLSASVEIDTLKLSIHLRIKPMNTFINPSYKINCALKMKKPN